jgi:hypothetical protein
MSHFESSAYRAQTGSHADDPFASTTALPVSEYPPYAQEHSRFGSADFNGRDESGRRAVYPPSSGAWNAEYGYEKGVNPVTRGSIAAQVSCIPCGLRRG